VGEMAHTGDVGTEIDGDGHAARKFFNLSERYEGWRDYRVDPHGRGLHGLDLGRARWCG
jgi:hypothetical protein